MTDRVLEDVVASWYRSRADAEPMPERLRARVLALPEGRGFAAWRLLRLGRPLTPRVVAVALLTAALLGLALGAAAGMLPRIWPDRAIAFPANLDACTVLESALRNHPLQRVVGGDHGRTVWGAHVCANDSWDGSYQDRHLLIRTQPTTLAEAQAIIDDPANWAEVQRDEGYAVLPAVWRPLSPGLWAGSAAADAREQDMDAIAVSREPYFFIVTGRLAWEVVEDAVSVAAELGVTLGDVDASDWPPIVLPVPTMWRP